MRKNLNLLPLFHWSTTSLTVWFLLEQILLWQCSKYSNRKEIFLNGLIWVEQFWLDQLPLYIAELDYMSTNRIESRCILWITWQIFFSSYNAMSRSERRVAMRQDLVKNLQPDRLLAVILRHIHRLFCHNSSKLLTPGSNSMSDLILATVSQNGTKHVRCFVKVIPRVPYLSLFQFFCL